jgi:hypothetical protein
MHDKKRVIEECGAKTYCLAPVQHLGLQTGEMKGPVRDVLHERGAQRKGPYEEKQVEEFPDLQGAT